MAKKLKEDNELLSAQLVTFQEDPFCKDRDTFEVPAMKKLLVAQNSCMHTTLESTAREHGVAVSTVRVNCTGRDSIATNSPSRARMQQNVYACGAELFHCCCVG